MGNTLDTLNPDSLVEFRIESDIRGAHSLLGECDNRLDGPGCTLLKRTPMYALVQMNGVFASDDILERGTSLTASL